MTGLVETPLAPPPPDQISDTGLSVEFITDLLLRTMYVQGAQDGQTLSLALRLTFAIIDDLLLTLQHRRLVEVRGVTGPGRGTYVFDLTEAGRGRAREAMSSVSYVGPAPVPLSQYRVSVGAQSIRHARVNQADVHAGLGWLVLKPSVIDMVGPAINSAKSLFLYGDSGNGKTAIAETVASLLGGSQFIPYAIEVNGEVLVLFDPVYHREVDLSSDTEMNGRHAWLGRPAIYDKRYVLVERPVVLTGGELSLDQLDLQYDPAAKIYQAPFQMKANGGVLIVDDFGRQRVPPRDLLNRWIVPLEKRVDFLTLHTGGKISGALRLPDHLRDEYSTDEPRGRGLPAAYPLQGAGGEPDAAAVCPHLRAVLRASRDHLRSEGGRAGLARILQALLDRAPRVPSP